MLSLHDPRWEKLRGGYRTFYDPRPALRDLETNINSESAWKELWDELHHQGDVDLASYAAVSYIVRVQELHREVHWNAFALVATIETRRSVGDNPPLPKWLSASYHAALARLADCAITTVQKAVDSTTLRSMLAVIALSCGDARLGRLLLLLDDDEIEGFLSCH